MCVCEIRKYARKLEESIHARKGTPSNFCAYFRLHRRLQSVCQIFSLCRKEAEQKSPSFGSKGCVCLCVCVGWMQLLPYRSYAVTYSLNQESHLKPQKFGARSCAVVTELLAQRLQRDDIFIGSASFGKCKLLSRPTSLEVYTEFWVCIVFNTIESY